MNIFLNRTCFAAASIVFLALLSSSPATARVKTGEVIAYSATTDHPYSRSADESDRLEIHLPGATLVKIHFSRFDLAPGDSVVVSNANGSTTHTYTGTGPNRRGQFWAFSVPGDRAWVQLNSPTGGGFGYEIDRVGRGEMIPVQETVCGSDGRQDAACFGPVGKSATRPVGRLLFEDGGLLFVCTGFLVDAPNPNTFMTNEHCIDSQAITDTLEVTFDYQRTNCGGFGIDPTKVYNGDQFLKSDAGLDYALVTLEGDPASEFGFFVATNTTAVSGELIVIPQHPGGNPKEIALYEDAAQSSRCEVINTQQTYGDADSGSQFNYACDTEGGSSGSPVLSLDVKEVVGLHHFGNVTFPQCTNAATHMGDICANAGSTLLNCS